MSEANKQLAREWFEQVWNQKDESAIDRLFHGEGKAHGFPDPDSALIGPKDFKAVHRDFCGAFPDIHIEIEDIVAEGNRVAIRWKSTMTHLGDHLGFPASGKKGALSGSSFLVARDGKIEEAWNEMDLQALMMKLRS